MLTNFMQQAVDQEKSCGFLSEDIQQMAAMLSDTLLSSNKRLEVVPTSPISDLVVSIQKNAQRLDMDIATVRDVSRAAGRDCTGNGSFLVHKDNIVNLASNIITKVIDNSRNVVTPLIKETIDKINTHLQRQETELSSTLGVIKTFIEPEILSNQRFLAIVRLYADKPSYYNSKNIQAVLEILDKMSQDDITSTVKQYWSSLIGVKATDTAWEYANASSDNPLVNVFDEKHKTIDLKSLIYTFMITRAIAFSELNIDPDPRQDKSYQNLILKLVTALGSKIITYLNTITLDDTKGKLFVSFPVDTETNVYYIYESAYDKLLENMKDINIKEALLGLVIKHLESKGVDIYDTSHTSKKDVRDVYIGSNVSIQKEKDFLNNPNRYLKIYEQYTRMMQLQMNTIKVRTIRSSVHETLIEYINGVDDEELKNDLFKRLGEVLSKEPYDLKHDLDVYLTDIYSEILFDSELMEHFMKFIAQDVKETQDIKTSLLKAIVYIVIQWLGEQVTVVESQTGSSQVSIAA